MVWNERGPNEMLDFHSHEVGCFDRFISFWTIVSKCEPWISLSVCVHLSILSFSYLHFKPLVDSQFFDWIFGPHSFQKFSKLKITVLVRQFYPNSGSTKFLILQKSCLWMNNRWVCIVKQVYYFFGKAINIHYIQNPSYWSGFPKLDCICNNSIEVEIKAAFFLAKRLQTQFHRKVMKSKLISKGYLLPGRKN